MNRRWFAAALFGCLSLLAVACTASATHPTLQETYRFLPRSSVLNQSGGSFGTDVDFRVYGKFDLLFDHDYEDPWTGTSVKFTNVEAWGAHPILAYVLMLDDVFNLAGLTGRQLPVAGPYDAYRFVGTTDNGSQVDLFAASLGPWLYLNGGTTPPPGSADYFAYTLKAVARTGPYADFDGNGVIDHADLARWTSHFSDLANPSLDMISWGDADGDHDVDGADFLEWQRQVGMTPPIAELEAALVAAQSTIGAWSVPEPYSLWVVVIAAWPLGVWRDCRRSVNARG